MKVALVPNHGMAKSRDAAERLGDWLRGKGEEVHIEGASVLDADGEGEATEAWYAVRDARGHVQEVLHDHAMDVRSCDLVIALGGDGTTLRAARLVGVSGIPLLSLNFGRLGFLSGGDAGDMFDVVTQAMRDELRISPRAALSVEVLHASGGADLYFALNEAVLHADTCKAVDFSLAVNDVELFTMRGDGIIVCTATGSTAYALSAGGPFVTPEHRGPLIVPLAPHTLKARPVVCGSDDVVGIVRQDTTSSDVHLFVDGKMTQAGDGGNSAISIRRGPADVILLKPKADTFYRSCARTFLS